MRAGECCARLSLLWPWCGRAGEGVLERELEDWGCLSARGRWRGGYQAGVSPQVQPWDGGWGLGDIPRGLCTYILRPLVAGQQWGQRVGT